MKDNECPRSFILPYWTKMKGKIFAFSNINPLRKKMSQQHENPSAERKSIRWLCKKKEKKSKKNQSKIEEKQKKIEKKEKKREGFFGLGNV